jgi:hypothetical protein
LFASEPLTKSINQTKSKHAPYAGGRRSDEESESRPARKFDIWRYINNDPKRDIYTYFHEKGYPHVCKILLDCSSLCTTTVPTRIIDYSRPTTQLQDIASSLAASRHYKPLRQHSRCVWQCSFLSTITERLFSSAIFSLSLYQLPPYRTDGQMHHIRNVTKADQSRHRSCKEQDHSSIFQTQRYG